MAMHTLPAPVRPANPTLYAEGLSLAAMSGAMRAPRSPIAAEMARFAAMSEAWSDMADAAQCSDERFYRAAKARFCAAVEGC